MAKYSEQSNKQFTNLLVGEILLLLYSIPEFRQIFKDSLASWYYDVMVLQSGTLLHF